LGLIAGWGGTYRLPRRVGVARARELFFTGKVIEAQAAFEMGLVDFVGDPAAVETYLSDLLANIRACSRVAIAEMKRLVNLSPTISLEAAGEAEALASQTCFAADDTQARLTAFFASRR
jgi:enoyl-CoA hydratase